MRHVLATLGIALAAAAAGAALPQHHASASEILASTKHLTAKDCQRHRPFGDGNYVSRCTYSSAAFIDGNWNVMVRFILRDKNGKRVGVMGADMLYMFDKTGKLLNVIPGM